MNDILGKIVSIFLVVGIFFGLPMVYMSERAKTAEQLYLLTEATHFVDSACNMGSISKSMLDEFYTRVKQSKQGIYEISIMHESRELCYNEETDAYELVSVWYDESDVRKTTEAGERYCLLRGDFIKIVIVKKNAFGLFGLKQVADETCNISYGGSVRYEAY